MVVVVLLLGMLIRRRTLVVHGIHHQRFHPAVRHGKVPLAQGVMAAALTLRPVNGDLHGPRVCSSPVFGKQSVPVAVENQQAGDTWLLLLSEDVHIELCDIGAT